LVVFHFFGELVHIYTHDIVCILLYQIHSKSQ
jgi:hypothetical protein